MTYWLRGKRGGALVFLLISALVVGGLGWVTFVSLDVEREQLAALAQREEDKAQAERERQAAAAREEKARELDNKLRLALSLLDARVMPVLVQEENRPYNHYSAVYASPLALVNTAGTWKQETILEPSPLLSFELPDWMLLHFQTDEDGHWGSPQLLSESLTNRLGSTLGVETATSLAERQQARQKLLCELQDYLPPRDLLALVEQRSSRFLFRDNALVLPSNSKEANPPSAQARDGNPAPSQAPSKSANSESFGGYETRQGQSMRVQNDAKVPAERADANIIAGNIPRNGEDWFARNRLAPGAKVTLTRGPLVRFWITTADRKERLVVARAIHAGKKLICQGAVLDWPRLQQVLGEEVADVFPDAHFRPMREPAPPHPERTMTALPVELDPGLPGTDVEVVMPEAAGPALPVLGWTPLRVGIGLAWAAALVALLAAGLGGWSLLDLSERRIRFVSAVTHELRTPLTTLRLYLDMLTGGLVREEKQRAEYLETLNDEAERLNRLIANVLAFSRLENQRPRMHQTIKPVAGLLEQVQAGWQRRCQEAGKELVIENELPPHAELATDAELVQQVLGNLIDNACKYSRGATDRRVWLRAEEHGECVALEVEDRGPGVPAGERRAILRPFRRGREADETVGGVGLGLALAQRWVQMLGGRLTVQAGRDGTGACFRIELPGLTA